LSTRFYVFAWTCKKTNPKASPKSVIPKQTKAVVKISPIIFFYNDKIDRMRKK
jgi:hypothetical protein